MKILFICKDRSSEGYGHYGSFGLMNSAKMVCDVLNENNVEGKMVVVTDANSIDKEVTNYNPTHIIIEAIWVTPAKMIELKNLYRHKDRQWIIRTHSRIPFLSMEGNSIDWIFDYSKIGKNVHVSFNCKETNKEFSNLIEKEAIYLPNLYTIHDYTKNYKSHHHYWIDIGCFGSIRPLKNTLIQAVAAIKYADSLDLHLRFHINDRPEQLGDRVLKNLNLLFKNRPEHLLVKHKWMNHHDFILLLRQMNISMQVSMSETFNMVIADSVDNNIPVVVSKEIGYLPNYVKASETSVDSIFSVLKLVNKTKFFGVIINKHYLINFVKSALKHWIDLKFLN
jgi:hypothetical protein